MSDLQQTADPTTRTACRNERSGKQRETEKRDMGIIIQSEGGALR